MIDNLVTYHIHKHAPLPANDALAYQYVLAGNGVFVRAETRYFSALLPVTACTMRGLLLLRTTFQLMVPRIPRENVRAQLLRLQGNSEVVFLGLQPPVNGDPDPIFVRTVSVSLTYKVNLGDYNSITPGYTDWHDVRPVAHSPGELHMALDRMWQSLWANVEDEISRAQGKGGNDGFFGLPMIAVADLTRNGELANGRPPASGILVPAMQSASVPIRPVNGCGI